MSLKEKSFVTFSWIFHSFALFRSIYSKGCLLYLFVFPWVCKISLPLLDIRELTLLFSLSVIMTTKMV